MWEHLSIGKLFASFVFEIYSVALICVLIYNFYSDFRTRKFVKILGTVIRHERTGQYSKGNAYYRAVAAYEIDNFTYYMNSDNVIVGYPESILPPVGTVVEIKINPNNPDEAVWCKGKYAVLFYALFLFMLVIGIAVYSLFMFFGE